ncbi:hypothetical protein PtB15_11B149 [Puccinia triticina]|nr:hypothetical protein PtB15_11B149 [Puccinia triticina]
MPSPAVPRAPRHKGPSPAQSKQPSGAPGVSRLTKQQPMGPITPPPPSSSPHAPGSTPPKDRTSQRRVLHDPRSWRTRGWDLLAGGGARRGARCGDENTARWQRGAAAWWAADEAGRRAA